MAKRFGVLLMHYIMLPADLRSDSIDVMQVQAEYEEKIGALCIAISTLEVYHIAGNLCEDFNLVI